ncbi:MAG: peptide-binding protein [Candidatus Omnitrophica bacterium]|nr:peptide-binding protein [Candidatus Omnitrophota bacterium]
MKQRKAFRKQNRRLYLQNNKKKLTIPLHSAPLGILFLMGFFLLSAVFFLNTAFSDEDRPDFGGMFVTAGIGDARTLVPILASDSASGEIVGMIFNGLVKYDKDIKLTGDLASSWEIQNDGLTIIFHLRKNVKWHDGLPFTAEDVKFTYEKLIDPNVPTPYSGDFKKIKSLEIIDSHTVKVTYIEPFSPGLSSWGMAVMPKHLLAGENLLLTKFSRHPIGTGPYNFKRWKTGQRIDLVSNHEYFEHRPYIDRYIYKIIPDISTMFLELQTKTIDSMGLSPLQYKRLTDTPHFKKNYNKYKYPSFGYTYMAYNHENELFKDIRVRQAINYAVDKQEIIDGVLLGYGKICTGPFIPESWAYNENVRPFPFDTNKAKRLLKEAGWSDTDGNGYIDKKGKDFAFTILTNQGNDLRIKTAEIIQRRLKGVGIKVEIRVLEWAVFLNEFVNKKRFEAIILGWGLSRDPDCYDIWHSSKTKPGEFNFIGYSNPDCDKLLEEGRRTFDIEKRKEIYHRIQEILYEEQPYLFLYVPDALVSMSNRFKGIKPEPIGLGYNFIDWYVPKAEQRYKSK